tara:strand:+ start:238 stop:435 length:198 start_codon:yes stop_codon:yes gene_type:complete
MPDIYTPLEQDVLDQAERQRIINVHHYHEADNFERSIEAAEQISHLEMLSGAVHQIKPGCSDNAY